MADAPPMPVTVAPPSGFSAMPVYANATIVSFIPNVHLSVLFLRAHILTDEAAMQAKKTGSVQGEVVAAVTLSQNAAVSLLNQLAKSFGSLPYDVTSAGRWSMTLPGDPPSGNGGPASSRRPPPGGGPIAPPWTIPLVQAVTWAEPQPLRPFEIEPTLTACVTAQLPVLPEPLRPKGSPLLIVIECWSDGTFAPSCQQPGSRLAARLKARPSALLPKMSLKLSWT